MISHLPTHQQKPRSCWHKYIYIYHRYGYPSWARSIAVVDDFVSPVISRIVRASCVRLKSRALHRSAQTTSTATGGMERQTSSGDSRCALPKTVSDSSIQFQIGLSLLHDIETIFASFVGKPQFANPLHAQCNHSDC